MQKKTTENDSLTVTCWTADQQNLIELSVVADPEKTAPLGKRLEGKKYLDKIPLPIVESYQKSGEWKTVSANLSPGQIEYLHSKATKGLKCLQPGAANNPLYWKRGLEACTGGMVYNYRCANCVHIYDYYKFPGRPYLIRLGMTISDPDKMAFYAHIMSHASLTLRETKLPPEPKTRELATGKK